MKILVTGITGFVGQELGLVLVKAGHEVVGLSRRPESCISQSPFPLKCFKWDGESDLIEPKALEGVDAIVHLAGESVADGRWTAQRKKHLVDSRVQSAKNLLKSFQAAGVSPKVFISASAIGFYGDRADEELTEESGPGQGFLADLTAKWEAETSLSGEWFAGCRLAQLRIGVVLGVGQGFLGKVVPLFRSGLGGRLGSGKQWMNFIHVRDLVRLILLCLENPNYSGVINAVMPEPVTNKQMTRELAGALGVPAPFPAPKLALKLALGEMSQMLLASQRVLPRRLQELGFEYEFASFSQSVGSDLTVFAQGFELFTAAQWVPESVDRVFDFYRDENNLQKITPAWLDFRVLDKSTAQVEEGTRINYRLKLKGIPIKWQSLIENWRPPERFSDRQLKGPYRHWFHLHEFAPLAGGTWIGDRVEYRLPLGGAGRLVAGAFVRKDVESIFKYRRQVVEQIYKNKS